jgi:hypothetical protein
MAKYPDDEDGAVLADLEARGIDMSRPLTIEFAIAAPSEASAIQCLEAVTQGGYDSYIEFDEGEPDDDGLIEPDDEEFGPSWTIFVNIRMVPDYDDIVRVQADLDRLAAAFGGRSDGWGVMIDGDTHD